jgi:hypothetical protein
MVSFMFQPLQPQQKETLKIIKQETGKEEFFHIYLYLQNSLLHEAGTMAHTV